MAGDLAINHSKRPQRRRQQRRYGRHSARTLLRGLTKNVTGAGGAPTAWRRPQLADSDRRCADEPPDADRESQQSEKRH
jgi:hypothetical protein